MSKNYYLGLMSGTSMDGVDAAIATFNGSSIEVTRSLFKPYPKNLKTTLSELITPHWSGSLEFLQNIDDRVGKFFAQAAVEIISEIPQLNIRAIGTHGQTIRHQPSSQHPNSWQIGNPSLIAEATGVTTIADWRRRDIAAGGQGAPFAPAFHAFAFQQTHTVGALNLGGIANISVIPTEKTLPTSGFDTGPANTLLDGWINQHKGHSFDRNGDWAAGGIINHHLLDSMLTDPYFKARPPKSTGRELFNLDWLALHLKKINEGIPPQDIQTTLTELTAKTITDAIKQYAPDIEEIFICGGGVKNRYLLDRLRQLHDSIIWESTAAVGIEPENVEAVAFAWFAKQTLEGIPLELTTITGSRNSRIAGAIYPGNHGILATKQKNHA